MRRSTIFRSSLVLFVIAAIPQLSAAGDVRGDLKAALLSVKQSDSATLRELRRQKYNAIVLDLGSAGAHPARAAAARIRESGFGLYYWIEVARCPELADAHPEWMASLQGHPEWRRLHPDFPQPRDGEVVKNYPWVPISYRESFDAHLERIRKMLAGLPKPDGIFLNDLQSAPSACGCGNTLCRWTSDYGPIKTATPLGPDSAAKFVAEVRKIAPGAEVIPVWLSECQEHESKKGAACDGVSCFSGTCWREWTAQLMPLATGSNRIGALLTHGAFGLPDSWIESGIRSFQKMPPIRGGKSVPVARVIPILQAWKAIPQDRSSAIPSARAAGSTEFVVAMTPIEQSWTPRMVKVKR